MESAAATTGLAPVDTSAPGAKGLKAGALGYMSNVVIAVASTAPAYSLATTLGFIAAVAGITTHAPAILIVSFVPILFISFGYRYLNLADPDAGTTFAWVTRAMGPQLGWINGWAIVLADVIVMASLADIASIYTFQLVGWTSAANSQTAIIIGSVVWIALMTWICYRGIELSARIQMALLSLECLTLAIFAVVALVDVYSSGAPAGSTHIPAGWFNPFALNTTELVGGVLLGMFIYWGWDSGVAVNEESENPAEGPGRAAVLSTILLVLIYVIVATAAQADAGTQFLVANQNDVLSGARHSASSARASCRSCCSSRCSPRRRRRRRRRSCRRRARRSRWRAGARCRRCSRASTRASRRRASRRSRWAACRSSGPSGCS